MRARSVFSRAGMGALLAGFAVGGADWQPADATSATLLWHMNSGDPAAVTYGAGTSADIRELAQITCAGSMGDTLVQGTVASRPVAGSFLEGRAAFWDGDDDRFFSSLPATDWNFLTQAPWTICGRARNTEASGTHVLIDCSNGSLFNRGLLVHRIGDDVQAIIYNDAGGNSGATWTGAAAGWQNASKVVVVAYNGTDTAQLWVDGVDQGTQPLTPSAGAVSLTLAVGRFAGGNTNVWKGWIPELFIYDAVLSQADRQNAEAYLVRLPLEVGYADSATPGVMALFDLGAAFSAQAGTWEDRTGNHPVSQVGAPTDAPLAAWSNKTVHTGRSSGNYHQADSLAAALAGDDTHFSFVVAASTTAGGNSTLYSAYRSGDIDRVDTLTNFSTLTSSHARGDSAGASSSNVTLPGDGAPHVFGDSFRGTTISRYVDRARLVDSGALDRASLVLDNFSFGIWKGASFPLTGAIGEVLFCTRALNQADYMALAHMLKEEYFP